jgi:hypothetical protein
VSCCIECRTGGQYYCRRAWSEEQCLDHTHWGNTCSANGGIADTYVTWNINCPDVCGKIIPCCLPSGTCVLRTYRQCIQAGGVPSGTCLETCHDQEYCCPPPVPCCICGECQMLSEQACANLGGDSIPLGTCAEIGNTCILRDLRPCRSAVMLPVLSATVLEHYNLLSTAPLPELEPYQETYEHRFGHVWDEAWFCHNSHKGRMLEKPMGFALQDDAGSLGSCVPAGHGAFIAPYREACEPLLIPQGP